MFTPEQRERIREELLDLASRDERITGAAITGSGAEMREDRWSDIDLAFGVADAARLQETLENWTRLMRDKYGALHHVDVHAGAWVYRVFILPTTLQVDLAFSPASEFRPLASTFRLISGEAKTPKPFPPLDAAHFIGLGWLYALHARSSIARGKVWQAEYMISGVRDHALALASVRRGFPSAHARAIDQLPSEVLAQFEGALVRSLDPQELCRAFRAVVDAFILEIEAADANLASRLRGPLLELPRTIICSS